jgi:hypothetical protein
VRGQRPHEERHTLTNDQLIGEANRFARVRLVVAKVHLQLEAGRSVRLIHLADGELDAFLVRFEERGKRLVAVDLADPNDSLRGRRPQFGHTNPLGQRTDSSVARHFASVP